MKWTAQMYDYLAMAILSEMSKYTYQMDKSHEDEIRKQIEISKSRLSKAQIDLVKNKAIRIGNDYYENVLDELKEMWHCESPDYDYGEDDFIYPPIEYDEQVYNIWMEAVKKRITVFMKYESTTSGITERYVDPYKTRTPYGEAYCHRTQEVRKFRFDRVISIKKTTKNFLKPKSY